jgi:hypothetical protein
MGEMAAIKTCMQEANGQPRKSKKAPQPSQTNKQTTKGLIHSSRTLNPQRQKAGKQAGTPASFFCLQVLLPRQKPARDNGQQAP